VVRMRSTMASVSTIRPNGTADQPVGLSGRVLALHPMGGLDPGDARDQHLGGVHL
jgi:hypothetical protein